MDLISQDKGLETRVLLADGLGSVRMELVGGAIQTVTTFEPYGKLLAQTGDSGTVYGYTGEQYDSATSLVYLRARYYNPNLKLFMSRDPFPGFQTLPASQHPYSYAHNNPVNLTDASGQTAIPIIAVCLANPFACLAVIGLTVLAVSPELRELLADALTEVCTPPSVTPGTRDRTIEDLINDLELFDDAEPQPSNDPDKRYPPLPWDWKDDNDDENMILVVGDGDFEYSKNLSQRPKFQDWEIIGTSFQEGGSNRQRFYDRLSNLTLFTDVDATKLHHFGTVTSQFEYEAVIFNNPYAGPQGELTATLISEFKTSARNLLSPSLCATMN